MNTHQANTYCSHPDRRPYALRREANSWEVTFKGQKANHLHAGLAAALDAEGRQDAVLRAFALHLHEYLLVPSGRGGAYARAQAVSAFAGCFTYQPPPGVVWSVECGVQSPKSRIPQTGSLRR